MPTKTGLEPGIQRFQVSSNNESITVTVRVNVIDRRLTQIGNTD